MRLSSRWASTREHEMRWQVIADAMQCRASVSAVDWYRHVLSPLKDFRVRTGSRTVACPALSSPENRSEAFRGGLPSERSVVGSAGAVRLGRASAKKRAPHPARGREIPTSTGTRLRRRLRRTTKVARRIARQMRKARFQFRHKTPHRTPCSWRAICTLTRRSSASSAQANLKTRS
jgi:hypothetical protein